MLDRLARVRIVLVATSHPGNIGSAARAMRTMGLSSLWLVAPREFPSPEATAMASGADAILESAHVVATLDEAIAGCVRVYGATPKPRRVPMPELAPREAAPQLLAAAAGHEVALVFGTERIGLTNEEIERCHVAVNIPASAEYNSLNLAQAVQVLCYELRLSALHPGGAGAAAATPVPSPQFTDDEPPADATRMEAFFGHLETTLGAVDFFKGRPSYTIMRRLRRIFLRAQLSTREVLILRGILADVERAARLAGLTSPRQSAEEPASSGDAGKTP
jgi:tRNA (cytidine32/uridine32-2'-O)-methyltransferase